MKTKWLSVLALNKFTFGDQVVSQFVVFECKYLFSIIIFYFHKTNGIQDRYHTHAFNAVSIKLFGEYTEHTISVNTPKELGKFINVWNFGNNRRTEVFRYIPKDCFHCIGQSSGCMTILLSGPWGKEWKEFVNGKVVTYTWGREKNG